MNLSNHHFIKLLLDVDYDHYVTLVRDMRIPKKYYVRIFYKGNFKVYDVHLNPFRITLNEDFTHNYRDIVEDDADHLLVPPKGIRGFIMEQAWQS